MADIVIVIVIAGAGPKSLMLACELAMAGVRPVVLDPLPGPNPYRRANGIVGQGVRIIDHRDLDTALAETADPPPGRASGPSAWTSRRFPTRSCSSCMSNSPGSSRCWWTAPANSTWSSVGDMD